MISIVSVGSHRNVVLVSMQRNLNYSVFTCKTVVKVCPTDHLCCLKFATVSPPKQLWLSPRPHSLPRDVVMSTG